MKKYGYFDLSLLLLRCFIAAIQQAHSQSEPSTATITGHRFYLPIKWRFKTGDKESFEAMLISNPSLKEVKFHRMDDTAISQ